MKAEKFTLSNGLDVVYLHLPNSLEFRLMLDVPVGAIHDPVGKEGLSHILEHKAFCGTESTSEKGLSDAIKLAGGRTNAETGKDMTSYKLFASAQAPDNFQVISDVLRQIITEPLFDPKRTALEEKVIVNERASGIDSLTLNPLVELGEAMHQGEQPFTNVIGTKESILSVTGDDLRQFMRENYDASQMTLYASGPLELENVKDTLESTLSAIPNLHSEKKERYQINCRDEDIRKERKGLEQNFTTLVFVTPNLSKSEQIIQLEARKHLACALPEFLGSQYGCFYEGGFSDWSSDGKASITYLRMENIPEDSVTACHGIGVFAEELEEIIPDSVIQASLDKKLYGLSDETRIGSRILNLVQTQYTDLGVLFDLDAYRKEIKSVSVAAVRQKMRAILGSLKGMYVQGPEPDRPLSLERMQELLSVVHDPAPIQKPAVAPAFNA